MPDYSIGSLEEPSWHIDAAEFALKLAEHYPDARVAVTGPEEPRLSLEALIPASESRRSLGVRLHRNGTFITLDPADPRGVAEFAVWFVRQVPAADPEIHVINASKWPPLPVTMKTSEHEILTFLSG